MSELSPPFRAELEAMFLDLANELHAPPFQFSLDASTNQPALRGTWVLVPVRFEIHWRRFHNVPLDLVRGAAYRAYRALRPEWDEADLEVAAERFMRDHLLSGPTPA